MEHPIFPLMTPLRQHFDRKALQDIPAEIRSGLETLKDSIKPGARVGITVGSRGINNILVILETIIDYIRECGASPVLLAAMGSHGGGTQAGQEETLRSLGITEERLGAAIITCVEGREAAVTSGGWKVYMLESAYTVDALLSVNRIKTHTSFKGTVESGPVKMLVVGLGGPPGAAQFHSVGNAALLAPLLEEVGEAILESMPVIGGVAVIENAYEETAAIEVIAPKRLIARERELLLYSKSLMPALPVDRLDGLVVGEMGKNFSGTGLDTNIIGRLRIQGREEPLSPQIKYVSVLDLSEASHGNATGIGLADFATQKLVDKIDRKATYLNNMTTTFVIRAFLPLYFDTDQECLGAMMHCLRNTPPKDLRLVFIANTLHLAKCWVSQALLPELEDKGRFEILGPARQVAFDSNGNLDLPL
ncbi:DUF362 domain-containing protein [Desulfovibrio sp. OttesenSCG-928-G11]|nr:DUF362 domain-containing protein [Desulfovibrio sp. OttesenSCG-928-G11]